MKFLSAISLLLLTASSSYATLAYDSSGSGTGTTSLSWTHTISTDPQAVIVYCIGNASSTDVFDDATYDSVSMTKVLHYQDSTGEPGFVEAYFLGSGVPTTNNPTVVCSCPSCSGDDKFGVSYAITASGNTELAGVNGFCTAGPDVDDPSCTVGGIEGASYAVQGLYSGINGPGVYTQDAAFTQGPETDFGSQSALSSYGDTELASGNWTCGFTKAGSSPEDNAMICVAIQEAASRRIFIVN